MFIKSALLVTLITQVLSLGLWDQCGGLTFSGDGICDPGLVCVVINRDFEQCKNASKIRPAFRHLISKNYTEFNESFNASWKVVESRASPQKNRKLIGCEFAYGLREGQHSQNSPFDYFTIWIGYDPNFHHSGRLDFAKKSNKLPVFYAYIIAFEARSQWGLKDCDVGSPNLCESGANFIRQRRNYLVERYAFYAKNIAKHLGANASALFLIEPDFYQYYSKASQMNGTLTGGYMRYLYDDFAESIKRHLPNAMISWDISAWATEAQMTRWWGFFKTSRHVDFIHTSGGQSRPDSVGIKPRELTWSFMNKLTGRKIIADCGYGVAGASSQNCMGWRNITHLRHRIRDGVIAVSQGSFNFNPTLRPRVC